MVMGWQGGDGAAGGVESGRGGSAVDRVVGWLWRWQRGDGPARVVESLQR